MKRSIKTALLTVASVVIAVLLVAGGFLLGANPDIRGHFQHLLPWSSTSSSSSSGTGVDYALQDEVLKKLESTYYTTVDPAALEDAAIRGMVDSLGDIHTNYWDAEEYKTFLDEASASYSGVGMVVEMHDHLVTVVSTFKDSPAARAGIGAGDIIVSVDGVSTQGQNLEQVVSRIKGPEGTSVSLDIYRLPTAASTTTTATTTTPESGGGATGSTTTTTLPTVEISNLPAGGTTTSYTLTRQKISLPVTAEKTVEAGGKKVALIDFTTFSSGSANALRAEVKQAVETDHVAAIILDLRGNGGGYLDEAVEVASIFIQQGLIVSTEGQHSPKQILYAAGDALAAVPLYMLTDKNTASASEIVAGALQDYKRGIVVGTSTYGKDSVQSIEPLSNGGALHITTAHYLTPLGRDLNTGITPDVVAPDDPATTDVDETLQAALDLISGKTTAK